MFSAMLATKGEQRLVQQGVEEEALLGFVI